MLARTAALDPGPSSNGPADFARPVVGRATTAAAAAAMPIARRALSDEPRARPHLSLVTPKSPPAIAPAPHQQVTRSAAERLALETGSTLEQGEGGLQTIHFAPPAIAAQQPYTVSRELADPAPPSMPAHLSAPAEGSAAGERPGMDPETMYEYFLERFKRDLLVEREQLGHLIIDNP